MLYELVVSVIPKVSVRLQHRPDIAFPGVKLASKLLRGKVLSQSDGVIYYGVDASKPIEGQKHEVQHVITAVSAVEPCESRIRDYDAIPPLPSGQCGRDVGRVYLMDGHRTPVRTTADDGIGVAPALKPRGDAIPKVESVGVVVRPDRDEPVSRMILSRLLPLVCLPPHRARKGRYILGDQADAGIERRYLHRRGVADVLTIIHGRRNYDTA